MPEFQLHVLGLPYAWHACDRATLRYVQQPTIALIRLIDQRRVAVTFGSLERRTAEYVDHLHEHFLDPPVTDNGRYMVPEAPGYGITMKDQSIAEHRFSDGPTWTTSDTSRRDRLGALGEV